MINVSVLQGNLTKDPELRTTQSGKSVVTFTIAVNRYGSEACDYIPCVAWERIADTIYKSFSKGSKIVVSGSLQSRQYEDKSGQKRTAYEVVVRDFGFCEKKERTATPAPVAEGFSTAASQDFIEITEDDDPHLPF